MHKNDSITVSYIVTVYNKESYIAATVRSILRQEGAQAAEYIFVDDVSQDRSVEIIETMTRGMPNVTIIRNTVNAGPSVRLNQGARLARGRYLQFFDSDDIMAANATAVMLGLLQAHGADLVYGRWSRERQPGFALLGRRIAADPPYSVVDQPLEYVLRHHYTRMTLMVRREVFQAADGCDESIFIQDESLPLRLAACARRFVALEAPVMFVPAVEGVLSANKAQLNHDRFLANRNMLQRSDCALSETARTLLFRRCVSAAWKQYRSARPFHAHASRMFMRYLASKLWRGPVSQPLLEELSAYFAGLKGIRHVCDGGAAR